MSRNDTPSRLGRIEGQLAQLVKHLEERNARDANTEKDVETRLRSVERNQWFFSGGATLAGAVFSLFLSKWTGFRS